MAASAVWYVLDDRFCLWVAWVEMDCASAERLHHGVGDESGAAEGELEGCDVAGLELLGEDMALCFEAGAYLVVCCVDGRKVVLVVL